MDKLLQIELDDDFDYAIRRVMDDEAYSCIEIEDIETGDPIDCMFFDAVVERVDKGYVLRKYQGHLEYDEDLKDYVLNIFEMYREYWYEGKRYYYAYDVEYDVWERVNKTEYLDSDIESDQYYIINYENDYDPMSSGIIDEILNEHSTCDTFIETLGKNYKAFRTLKKYGFNDVLNDFVYVGGMFNDSDKISEVLGVDYNKVIAESPADEITASDIFAMRELALVNLKFSKKNISIMHAMRTNSKIFDYIPRVDMRKTFKYLRNQASRAKSDVQILTRDYADYLTECSTLGLDLSKGDIRYPTDLSVAHARTSGMVVIKNNADMEERIRALYDRCRDYVEWTDGEYSVVMPASCVDIIEEGKKQSHCVGSYAERMAKGEDIIIFIRKNVKPEQPFYTAEIRPNFKKLDIIQCRGFHNRDESVEVRASVDAFLDRYKHWFDNRQCDMMPNMKRKYYKAVRKTNDGRYISNWDQQTEYRIGEVIESRMEPNPDLTAVRGIHIASLEFAKKYGEAWNDAAILEIEVDMKDVVIPNAKDQLRASRGKVIREVPITELGEWGHRHDSNVA